MAKLVTVLSIDGGGIRGIIPALVLSEIEKNTGKHIAGLFDLIAGTSTGGILALGLTMRGPDGSPKYSAQLGIDLYEREGKRIFKLPFWRRLPLFDEKYSSQAIEEVLEQYFGNARLQDALAEVLVTSYDIERTQPYFFKRSKAREDATRDVLIRMAARAASAAPTYFEPAKVPIEGSTDYRALIDGGLFANNPAMCALAEVVSAAGGEDVDVLLVSLGTGQLTRRLAYERARKWGYVGWVRPILSVMFDGVSDAVDYQLKQQLRPVGGAPRYFRFQLQLPPGNDSMDDASPGNIRQLKYLAEDMIRENEDRLKQACEILKVHVPAVAQDERHD